ncbi:MAG: hypothetical protein HC849_00670 [Oscillatoriales cyanobacterium RU_3_3]|nr:hypothetical protein [Oscillatoriales cyanobacterium RU_3_3]
MRKGLPPRHFEDVVAEVFVEPVNRSGLPQHQMFLLPVPVILGAVGPEVAGGSRQNDVSGDYGIRSGFLGADFGERQLHDSFGRCLSLQDFNSPVFVGIGYGGSPAVVSGGSSQMFDRFEFSNSQNGLRRAKHGGVPPDNNKSLVSIGPGRFSPNGQLLQSRSEFQRAIASKSIGIEESNYLKGSRNLDVAARVRARANSNGKLF